jgi:PIN domain nuclease of toxin-antitoxin system
LCRLRPPRCLGDPADQLLIANAIELGCPLITYNERIVEFGKTPGRQFDFATAA